ncbi:MAG TPA: PspA/IM30 family protein, partial [Methylobacterium sp.]|jgi:phage shock protein A
VRRLGVGVGSSERATLREAEATLARLRELQTEAADTETALAEAEPGASIAERLEREGFGPRTRPSAASVLERLRTKASAPQPL